MVRGITFVRTLSKYVFAPRVNLKGFDLELGPALRWRQHRIRLDLN